jgi:choline/glycine/proline betaine transport protein
VGGRHPIRRRDLEKIGSPVFAASGLLLLLFLAVGVLFTRQASAFFPLLLEWVSAFGGWIYVGSIAAFIGVAVWLVSSRYAGVRLGADDERPRFPLLSWFAMLFSAGMGIGLVFYGVAEPMMHFTTLPGVEPLSPDAAARAVPTALFHWGIHAWSTYLLMGLGIAYFSFRKGLPLAVRSCLYPMLGDRIYGPVGHLVDTLAVFGTLFGLATSLGLGAMQISAGLEFVFGVTHGLQTQLILIGTITGIATISLISGIHRGIRRLSELNLVMASGLLLFVIVVGPTGHLGSAFVANLGGYGRELLQRTFAFGLLRGDSAEWSGTWTIFYWGWWIAWAPFVGLFVARISRGRTIREFVLGVLLVPPGLAVVWFTVFGNTALYLEIAGAGIAQAVSDDVSTAIYTMLAELPLASMTSALAAAVVAVFFVTSSDSASLVVDILTSGGHPDPPRWRRVFWAVAEGSCAAVLLYAGGERALSALQAAVVSIGLPVCLLLLLIGVNLVLALRREPVPGDVPPAPSGSPDSGQRHPRGVIGASGADAGPERPAS